MKKLLIFVVVTVVAYGFMQEQGLLLPGRGATGVTANNDAFEDAFANRLSDIQIGGEGKVSRILRDDLEGSRHQKFIVQLSSGQSLLISHNIDLAPRVADLATGDTVTFFGEYEWNPNGGVVHWTHHDPAGRHIGGWIKHRGKTYR
jgi:hypothetical protein